MTVARGTAFLALVRLFGPRLPELLIAPSKVCQGLPFSALRATCSAQLFGQGDHIGNYAADGLSPLFGIDVGEFLEVAPDLANCSVYRPLHK